MIRGRSGSALLRAALCLSMIAATAAPGPAHAQTPPPEPPGYRTDNYRAPTPPGLAGAKVLSADDAMALRQANAAIFIDVMPRPHRPEGLPAGTVWHVPDHPTIPGSVWLPNTGYGVLNPSAESYFREALASLSKGDRHAALVFFCLRDCWMSWNAAKRALALGYANVQWFPDGADGWTEAGGSLEPATPVEPAP